MADFTGTSGDDIITGTDDSDFIDVSQGGNDTVNAEGGDDVIFIGATLHKGDHIDGGSGYDTLQLDGDYGNLKLNQNLIANIEDIALGVGHDYHITLAKTVATGGATLTIDGSALGAGDALYVDGSKVKHSPLVLDGGAGNDTLIGGKGGGAIDGGDGNDMIACVNGSTVSGGNGDDTINFATNFTGGDIGHVDAGAGNDLIVVFFASVTDGELQGGSGTDELVVGTLTLNMSEFSAATSGFEVLGVSSTSLFGGDDNANNLDFSGFAFQTNLANYVIVHGAGGDDLLVGNLGNDRIFGDDGDDKLIGGVGKDYLTGGSGADIFVYTSIQDSSVASDARDVIKDFHHSEGDLIDLSMIDADTTQDGNQAFHLGGNAFSNSPGELIQFVDAKGHTIIEGDTNGDGVADFAIQINHGPVLVVEDFVM